MWAGTGRASAILTPSLALSDPNIRVWYSARVVPASMSERTVQH